MKCNLIKTIQKKKVDGKDKTYTHFKLVFENGKTVRICAEWIPSENIKDQEKKDAIYQSNKSNVIVLDAMADLVKYETTDNN